MASTLDAATPDRGITRSGVWLTDLSLFAMALIWGVNFSVVKFGTTLIAPLAYNSVRISLAALSLVAIVRLGRIAWPPRRVALALFALGMLGNGLYQIFFVEGVSRTRAGDAALVIAASPALIALLGRFRRSEHVSARGFTGIALSIAGIALIVFASTSGSAGDASMLGDALVLAGACCWALYTVLLQPYTANVDALSLSAVTMLGGMVPLLVVATPDLLRTSWRAMPVLGWAAIAYSGLLALVVAYLFWYRGMRVLGPTRTAMYSNLQPLIALVFAWIVLGEVPTVWQGIGAASIMGGLVLTRA
jgi:drug/metabolite transporter (DMT)-like permease